MCLKFSYDSCRNNAATLDAILVLTYIMFYNYDGCQVPWMQVSRSRSLLLMVKPAAFIVAIGMGMYVHSSFRYFPSLIITVMFKEIMRTFMHRT